MFYDNSSATACRHCECIGCPNVYVGAADELCSECEARHCEDSDYCLIETALEEC